LIETPGNARSVSSVNIKAILVIDGETGMSNQPEQPNSEWLNLFEEALESAYEAGKDDANHNIDIEERAKAAIEAHEQAAVAEARILSYVEGINGCVRLIKGAAEQTRHITMAQPALTACITELEKYALEVEATLRTSKPQEEKSE
jgi:hypothetical protein